MIDRSELEAKLAVIKCAYVAELPARAASLRAAWDRVQTEDWAQEPLQELHRLAHSLAGSGATFGFVEVSAHARALEIPLKALLQDASADRSALPDRLAALTAALTAASKSGA